MFDPIPAHELCKYFVCKMASPITNDSPGVPNLLKMFYCKKLTTVLASFLGQAIASTHLET